MLSEMLNSGGERVDARVARRPEAVTLRGRWVRLEPLDAAQHSDALWGGAVDDELWTYLLEGPFADRAEFDAHLARKAAAADALFFAIVDEASEEATGYASLMRIEPAHRAMEVGNILYTPRLQRTAGGTEAMYLLARYVFEELGYRRYEWKCNALNEPSRRAALRLGFTFEGIFRQHMIAKGRNRDTAWFSMLDAEWPERRRAFERWLDPQNFDADGQQRTRLKPDAE